MAYIRSANIVAFWGPSGFQIEEFCLGTQLDASHPVIALLDIFSVPRRLEEAPRLLPQYTRASVDREVRNLIELGFLVRSTAPRPDVARAWSGSFPAAYYHLSTRRVTYLLQQVDRLSFVQERLKVSVQPPFYKAYPRRPGVRLPDWPGRIPSPIDDVLHRRRTSRSFSHSPVPFADLAAIVSGTWGQMGWVDGGVFGRLLLKTSPSAGARHPIECYVIAWRVDGLMPGLYHYSVKSNRLEVLRRGDLRLRAVRIASGIPWIRDAAFLCVMTAMPARLFWKYPNSKSYSILYLDAGHLGQTFSLLATSHGLGPFTTAAIAHAEAEKLIGIDGIREFPIYLCGAGKLPERSRERRPRGRRPVSDVTSSPERS